MKSTQFSTQLFKTTTSTLRSYPLRTYTTVTDVKNSILNSSSKSKSISCVRVFSTTGTGSKNPTPKSQSKSPQSQSQQQQQQQQQHFPEEHVEPEAPFSSVDPLSEHLYPQTADASKPLFSDSRTSIYSAPTAMAQVLPYVKLGDRSNVSGLVVTIFGASGFIGKYVASQFASVGSQVILPYRGDGVNVRELKVSGELGQVIPLPYDLSDKESIRRCVSRSNVVINCIGTHYETSNFSYHDTHVKVPYRIAEICREIGVERFVHLSPIGADPSSESEYYRSHGLGEKVIKSFYPDATIIRASTVFGSGDNFVGRIADLGFYLWRIPVANGGNQRHALLHAEDLSQAILAATVREEAVGKTYELGGPDSYTYNEIIDIIGRSTYTDLKPFPLPDFAAKLYGDIMARPLYPRDPPFLTRKGINPTLAGILDSLTNFGRKLRLPHYFHRDMVPQSYVNLIPDIRLPGINELGVQPRTFLSSIENAVYFMQNNDAAPEEFMHASRLRDQSTPGSR